MDLEKLAEKSISNTQQFSSLLDEDEVIWLHDLLEKEGLLPFFDWTLKNMKKATQLFHCTNKEAKSRLNALSRKDRVFSVYAALLMSDYISTSLSDYLYLESLCKDEGIAPASRFEAFGINIFHEGMMRTSLWPFENCKEPNLVFHYPALKK